MLVGVYYRFANGSFDDQGNLSTKWTDIFEYVPSQMAGSIYDPENAPAVPDFQFSPSYYAIDSAWVYGFSLVNAANGFIENVSPVSAIPDGAKQQMLAEARFLRAFGNAELLWYSAQYRDPSSKYGIILRDNFVTAATVNLPRSSVSAAYTSILADLDIAIHALPSLNSTIYLANVWDAKLLKARVLMNKGAAGDLDQVITLTKDIIANGPFVLEDSLKDLFRTRGYSKQRGHAGYSAI
ncbi:RagB/SusD family nutrient uptake outer membrane protein [Puia sp. P3]|uniref:RagB/SusD family nutrient uptake outer membrane protein n=1 Tax=Puia sp. P3 TaxID=3423952 RepID=UPI003D668A7C